MVLLKGRTFTAIIEGKERQVTSIIGADTNGQMGPGIIYMDDSDKVTGSWWGILLPGIPARCLRAMRILECIKNFDNESSIPCYSWYAASISEVHSSDTEKVKKIEQLIGNENLELARRTKVTADEIDMLVTNMNNMDFNQIGLCFDTEIDGLFPITPTVQAYLNGTLVKKEKVIEIQAPDFKEIMFFNTNLLPLIRKLHTSGHLKMDSVVQFLKIPQAELAAMGIETVD